MWIEVEATVDQVTCRYIFVAQIPGSENQISASTPEADMGVAYVS
jgi:hypothetical protein